MTVLILQEFSTNWAIRNKHCSSCKKAIPLYESLIKKDSENHYYSYQLARCLEQQKQYQKAVKAYKNTLNKNPKYHKALYHLANHYSKKRDRDSTLYYIDKVLVLKPNNTGYLKLKVLTLYKKQKTYIQNYHLGLIAIAEHKPKRALEHFDKAYKNNPNYYDALYMRALTAENYYKDKKIALKDYKLYLDKFKKIDAEKTIFVEAKIKRLEEHLFFEGEK